MSTTTPGPASGAWVTQTSQFNSFAEPVSVTDAQNNTVSYSYSSQGNLLSTTSVATNIWTSAPTTSNYYNAAGQICASRDPAEVATYGILTSCATTHDTYETYNTYGDLLSTTDAAGNVTSSYYDADGNACATLSVAGYAAGLRLTSCPSSAQNYEDVVVSRGVFNNVTKAFAPLNGTGGTSWAYANLNGDTVATITSPGDPSTCNPLTTSTCQYTSYSTYDPDGQLISSVSPTATTGTAGPTTTTFYDPNGSAVASVSPDGNASGGSPSATEQTSVLNSIDSTVSSTQASNLTASCSTTSHSTASLKLCPNTSVSESDATGQTTATYTLNSAGTGDIVSSTTYNPDGSVNSTKANTGSSSSTTTTYTYDVKGEKLTAATVGTPAVGSPVSTYTTKAYNANGSVCWSSPQQWTGSANPTCATAPTALGNQTTYNYYDNDGRLVAVSGPGSNPYEPGNTSGCNPLITAHCAFTTYYTYNELGQRVTSVQPQDTNGNYPTTTSYYDINGNVIATQGPAGNPATCNPVTSSTCVDTIYRTYNVDGTPSSRSYTDGTPSVSYVYNSDGSRHTMSDGTGTTTYGYDAFGRLVSATNGAGATTTWGYNGAGQLACESYPNGSSNTCSTSGASSTSPPTGDVSFFYDSLGRLSSEATWIGTTLNYGYDCSGDVAWVSTGSTSSPECNASSIAFPSAPTASTAITTSYGFDGSSGLQTSQATTASGGSTNLLSFAFGYDPMGRLNSSTPTTNATTLNSDTYGFDAVNRVSSGPIVGSGSSTYGYTPANGITANTNKFATAGYSQSGELCWTSTTTGSSTCGSTPSPETKYGYNTDEQRTSVTPSSGGNSQSLAWNSTSQQLTCVNVNGTTCSTTNPTTSTTVYTYNANGLRATATFQGSTNAFTWNPLNQQLLADSTHDYIYGIDSTTPILQIQTTGYTTSPNVDLIVDDTNHNARGVVQLQGDTTTYNSSLVNYTDYDAYGNPITQSGGIANPGGLFGTSGTTSFTCNFGFGSSYTDASNFDYLVNRYYDPLTGQFLSLDPAVIRTMEPFSYAQDSPVNTYDPNGLMPLSQTCFTATDSNGNAIYSHPSQRWADLLGTGMKCWRALKGGMLLTSQFHTIPSNPSVDKIFSLFKASYSVAYSIYIQGSGAGLGRAMKMINQNTGSLMYGSKVVAGPTKTGNNAFVNAAVAADNEITSRGENPPFAHHGCGTTSASDVGLGGYPICYVDSGYLEVQASAFVGRFTLGGLVENVSIMLRARNLGVSCGQTCQIAAGNALDAITTASDVWDFYSASTTGKLATSAILGANDLFDYWLAK